MQDLCYIFKGKQYPLPPEDLKFIENIEIIKEKKQHAILLIHGFASSPAVYRLMINNLEKKYDAIICKSLPGHATDIDDFASTCADDWYKHCEAICQTLIDTYEKVDVMGMSLGGLLAYKLALKFKLNHLYLLGPAFALTIDLNVASVLIESFRFIGLKSIANRGGGIVSNSHKEITYTRLPLHALKEIVNLVKNTEITAIPCPSDVFLGRHDTVVDSNQVTYLLSKDSNTSIHWLENSSHVLPLDNDLDIILAVILS
jgi:carboxylesterase